MDAIAAAAQPKQAAVRPTSVVLEISSAAFRCVWASILVVRCVSALYLLASAALYLFLAQPTMVYYASILGSRAPPHFLPMAAFLATLALAQLYRIVCMVFWSCMRGELVFEATAIHGRDRSNAVFPLDGAAVTRRELGFSVTREQRLSWMGRVGHVWSSLWGSSGGASMWRLLFGPQGFFSIKSEYFEVRLALREFAEILSQTLQLQKASNLLVRHWITNLYAAIVVVNCWSTPVVQFRCRQKLKLVQHDLKSAIDLRRSDLNDVALRRVRTSCFDRQLQGVLALERLLCVAIDVVLDLATSIVIPAVILYPYVQQFDLESFSFGSEILYDDVRFVRLVYETQQVLATNFIEALLAIFPHWGIYAGCGNARRLLVRKKSSPQVGIVDFRASIVRVGPSVNARASSASRASRIKSSVQALPITSGAFLKRSSTWIRLGRAKTMTIIRSIFESNRVHVVFFLWGLAVLCLHVSSIVVARSHESSRPAGCKQVLRPWLTDKTACSVFEFNCYTSESTTVTESDFEELEREFLAVLILSHCPALVVPRSIREFPNLLGFETYNSTIVRWDQRSSFSPVAQTRLAYVQLLRTNMSSFPDGLATRLPANLLDVEISMSNLTALPDNLDQYWHPMAVLYVEHTGLSSFPIALSRLSVADCSLVGNQITSTSEVGDWSRATFGTLSLAHNPIEQLASKPIGDLDVLRSFVLEDTAVSELPVWVFEAARATRLTVYLKGSPFCRRQPTEAAKEQFGAGAFITCVDEAALGQGAVPIELITSYRPLVRGLPGGGASSGPTR